MNICIIFAVVSLQVLQASCCDVTTAEWGSWGACTDGWKTRTRSKTESNGSSCSAGQSTSCGSSGGVSGSSGGNAEPFQPVGGSPVGSDQQGCLDEHNKYRKTHNAPPLIWDAGIAKKAQEWADDIAANGMRHDEEKGDFGENLAYSSYSNAGGANSVKMWYDEICLYNNCATPPSGTGHFTQVVWKDSKYLGCAVAKNGNKVYTVGRYFPPGNYEGQYCAKVGTLNDVSAAKAKTCPLPKK